MIVITNYNFPGGYSDRRDDVIMLSIVPAREGTCIKAKPAFPLFSSGGGGGGH